MALNIMVLAGPSGSVSMDHEFDLLKSALLYGDQITLCSLSAWVIQGMGPLASMNIDEMFELVTHILSSSPHAAPGLTPQMSSIVSEYSKTVLKKKKLTTQENIVKQQILHSYKQVIKNFQKFNLSSGNTQLYKLIEAGHIQLHQFTATDMDSVIEEFVAIAAGVVADGTAYPLFDDTSGSLVKEIEKEKGETAEVDLKRIKHIHLAGNLFHLLPDLSSATLDEVIDIRSELNKYLINFRSKMVEMSDSISSAVWDANFPKEVEQLKISKIDPAIIEISEQIKTTKALKDFIAKPKELLKGAGFSSSVGAIISHYAHLDALTMATLGTSLVASVDALQKILESKNTAKKNQLYFYYQLNKKLG